MKRKMEGKRMRNGVKKKREQEARREKGIGGRQKKGRKV